MLENANEISQKSVERVPGECLITVTPVMVANATSIPASFVTSAYRGT